MAFIIHCVWKVGVHLGYGRVQLKCDGTRRTGGEVKGKLANGVDITYSAFYKCTETFRTSPPVRHGVPSHFNWTLPQPKCTATFRISPPVRLRVPSHFNWTLP